MNAHLSELKDDGWKEKDEFDAYKTALKGIPDKSDSCADKAFFDKLVPTFIEEYERTLKKHVLDRWRSGDISAREGA